MQTVTADFLTAIVARERQVKAKAELVLLDNSMLGSAPTYSASSTHDNTLTPDDLAFNGRIKPQRNYAWVGEDILPADNLYPVAADGSSEIGWWTDTQSDGTRFVNSGNGETLAIDYNELLDISTVRVYGDSRFGYPANFQIHSSRATTPEAELLSNLGFETAGGGGADVWANWEEGSVGAGNVIADETVTIHGGSHAASLHTGTPLPAYCYVQQTMTVVPGSRMLLSFWSTNDGVGRGRYAVLDNTNVTTIVESTCSDFGGPYVQYSVYFDIPDGCVSITLQLKSPATASTTAYFDDVTLTPRWVQLVSVVGNTLTEYSYDCSDLVPIRHLRLTVTRWSQANKRVKIIEFEGGYVVDITQSMIKSFSLTKERAADDEGSTLPYGNSSANELSLVLDNTNKYFYRRNTTSPYYGYLVNNRKIRLWLGILLPDDSIEYLAQGTYYTVSWQASRGSPESTVVGRDRASRMLERDFSTSIVYEDYTVSELAELLADAFGLVPEEYVIDATTETMPFAYFSRDKYWGHFSDLAKGETGSVYIDENDRLIFENRGRHFSTRLATAVTAPAGATSIVVDSVYGLLAGDTIYLDNGTNTESFTVLSSWDGSSTTVPLDDTVVYGYPVDSYVYKQPVVATLSESDVLTDLDDQYVLDKAKNKIEVKATPLIVPLDGLGSPVVETIWQLDETLTIPAGSYEDVDVFFSKEPVIRNATYTVDITVTTDPEADSVHITTAWQPSVPYAWGGHLRISNDDTGDVYVVGLLIEGVPLSGPTDKGGIIETAENTTLQSQQGERTYTLENQYIQRRAHAAAIANNLLRVWQDPAAPASAKGRGMPHLQLGDRVKLIDTDLGLTNAALNNHFMLTRIVLDFDGGLEASYDLLAA